MNTNAGISLNGLHQSNPPLRRFFSSPSRRALPRLLFQTSARSEHASPPHAHCCALRRLRGSPLAAVSGVPCPRLRLSRSLHSDSPYLLSTDNVASVGKETKPAMANKPSLQGGGTSIDRGIATDLGAYRPSFAVLVSAVSAMLLICACFSSSSAPPCPVGG